MNSADWQALLQSDLSRRREENLLRARREFTPVDSTHVEFEGKRYVNFASNNYLGLTHHPKIIAAMQASLTTEGSGSGAAGLISGYTAAHAAAERRIANWKGTESAVLLPSGYQANHAAVQTLAATAGHAGKTIRFLLDKLCHASLLDAVRGSGAEFRVFPHNQLAKLERLLESPACDQIQVVVTESIFSMDGDACDLRGLAALKQRRDFLLLLDEAHGAGVYGKNGSGYANELGLPATADVVIATLSKAAGVVGGAVCGSTAFGQAVINHGRAYIYSTAIPAAVAAGAAASIAVMRDEPQRQARVRSLARRVRDELSRQGVNLPPGDSPIVPVIVGTESAALGAAVLLRDEGLMVIAVRPPTVPRGSSRLRVTLSCDHSDEEVEKLIRLLSEIAKQTG